MSINKINKTTIIMHNVVMNDDNFVASQPRTIVQYTMKCETTTRIYIKRKLNTLIYVHYVYFCFGLCILLIFWTCFFL